MPYSALVILAASAAALAAAFTLQYVLDVQPCALCLMQRVPLWVAVTLAALALMARPYGKAARALLGLCAAVFVVGAAVAFFHTGVEQHWWLGTSGCALKPLGGADPESLREQLLSTVVARCDEVSWTFLGLSIANWNIPFSLALAGLAATAARRG